MNLACQEPVDERDYEALRVLLWDYIRELRQVYAGTRMLDQLDDATWTRELEALPRKYAPPGGALVLARHSAEPAGCVAMHRFDEDRCEMKRLYVAPAFRGHGSSRLLVQRLAQISAARGYKEIIFEVGWRQTAALAAYTRMGFRQTPAYRAGSEWFLAHTTCFSGATRELGLIEHPAPETCSP